MRIDTGIAPGQVLQRFGRTAIAGISGSCTARGPVTARLLRSRRTLPGWRTRTVGLAADGRFTARLAGLPVGGPYRLELMVGRERCAVDFFVGDVWILAGQSNMHGIGDLAAAPAPHPFARCLGMDGIWREARDPLHLLATSPDRCHAPTPIPYAKALRTARRSGKGTGPGVWFARELLRRDPAVPQGLIACAHSGTSMALWDPGLRDTGGASLYGSLLRQCRSTGQSVAGALWYQGEAECSAEAAAAYTTRMQTLVAAVRSDLGQPRLPWLMVQIGRLTARWELGPWWEAIREQQRLLPQTIPRLVVVPSIDLVLDDGIHIAGDAHAELGRRLARQAARLVLGDRGIRPEPSVLAARVRRRAGPVAGDIVEVRCRDVVGGWRTSGRGHGFALVKADGGRMPSVWRVRAVGAYLHLHIEGGVLPDCTALVHGPGTDPCCDCVDGRGAALPAFGPLPLSRA